MLFALYCFALGFGTEDPKPTLRIEDFHVFAVAFQFAHKDELLQLKEVCDLLKLDDEKRQRLDEIDKLRAEAIRPLMAQASQNKLGLQQRIDLLERKSKEPMFKRVDVLKAKLGVLSPSEASTLARLQRQLAGPLLAFFPDWEFSYGFTDEQWKKFTPIRLAAYEPVRAFLADWRKIRAEDRPERARKTRLESTEKTLAFFTERQRMVWSVAVGEELPGLDAVRSKVNTNRPPKDKFSEGATHNRYWLSVSRILDSRTVRNYLGPDAHAVWLRSQEGERLLKRYVELVKAFCAELPCSEGNQQTWYLEPGLIAKLHDNYVFAEVDPDLKKRIYRVRLRAHGLAEITNSMRPILNFTSEQDREWLNKPKPPRPKDFDEVGARAYKKADQENLLATLTPAQRAIWDDYWGTEDPPQEVKNAATRFMWGRNLEPER